MPDSSPSTEDIGAKVATGAAWMVLLKISVTALALINVTILARLLSPSDFGLVAMASFVYAVLDTMTWFGFDSALIQKQRAKDSHFNTAYTINILSYTLVALLLIAVAIPAASYYQEPQVKQILYAMAIGAFVTGFENIGIVKFRKELNFRKDFQFMVSKKLIAFVITVPLAFLLRNYWALVIGALAGRFGGVIMSYVLSAYRPRITIAKFGELFHFSKWIFLHGVFSSLHARIAEPILGRIFGATTLGYFTISYEISNIPTTEMVAPINRAVFPGYAKLSHDLRRLRAGYLKVIGVIALVALPAAAGIAATADILIPVWLGEKWLPSAPIMKLLACSGALTALTTNTGTAYLALGMPRLLAIMSGIYLTVLIVLIIPLAQNFGAIGAAWAYILSTLIVYPVLIGVVFHVIHLKPRRFFAVIWRPISASLLMYFLVGHVITPALMASTLPGLLSLFTAIGCGMVIYTVIEAGLWATVGRPDGAEIYILQRVKNAIGKRRDTA